MNDSCYVNRYTLADISKITAPLIFAALANTLMLFIDRFVLGLFSITAMNAASLVGNYISVITFFFIGITSIATIFIGQYNGECNFKSIAKPSWQMIYLSLLTVPVAVFLSTFTEELFFLPDIYREDGIIYQKLMSAFFWEGPLFMAISAFFIGRRKTLLVTSIVVISNILNFTLDMILVFGVDDFIPSFGAFGAALATVISQTIGIIVLLTIFFSRKNRSKFCTCDFSFDYKIFKDCIKIGTPLAFDRALNLLAWFLIFLFVGYISNDLATLESITVNFYIILCCYTEGLNKGISTIVANLIGENRISEVSRIFKTFMKINLVFSIIVAIPLVFYQDIPFYLISKMNGDVSHLKEELEIIFYFLLIIIVADGVVWIIAGILAAGGDTLIPMIINTVLLYIVVVVPTAIMYYTGTLNSMREINIFSAACSSLTALFLYCRYKRNSWRKIIV